ncbi:Uma2 family endonuclease [Trichothermofontia sichuanensis B231]|uniref:Uma2 family endonuclease n=1 Tax=Trichothermofontia sichuanensis TaxID=3045816 RepID=UPI0022483E4C|nr:Uma2 family endonuclease [Trichothermofontia sichuanensis B231]
MTTLAIALQPTLELTDEQFEEICRHNRDLRLERSARGELIIMPPTGGETGTKNAGLIGQRSQSPAASNLEHLQTDFRRSGALGLLCRAATTAPTICRILRENLPKTKSLYLHLIAQSLDNFY